MMGSVKSNVGHLLTAAGLGGVDKGVDGDEGVEVAADGEFCGGGKRLGEWVGRRPFEVLREAQGVENDRRGMGEGRR